MIKNVVFDFGQVVVHYEPEYMVSQYVSDKEDIALLSEVVFDRLYWDKLDMGTISDEEVLRACRTRLPERLWDVSEEIYYNWIYNIPEFDGIADLISYLKDEYGVRVLLLSNISKYFASHIDEIPIIAEFEGCVFSSLIGITKPNPKIFSYLCKKFKLKPNETVFIDDNENNVKASIELGINGYQFDGDVPKLKKHLDMLINGANS